MKNSESGYVIDQYKVKTTLAKVNNKNIHPFSKYVKMLQKLDCKRE